MKIQAMLNPADDASDSRGSSPGDSLVSQNRLDSPPRSAPKQDKVSKDGFSNVKGEPRKSIQYPPHEIRQDPDIAPKLDEYSVKPDQTMGKFADYPRHIPYTSTKRDLQKKASLKDLNVFQYEFSVKGEANQPAKKHLVLWDYHVGLVRITPFFKALNYSKTTPKKAIDGNVGLADLTISITGGALAAQGYWMPFECAKALACTFCYSIRYVLAPIFGRDFLDECLPLNDPNYGKFLIDPAIIKRCTADVDEKQEEGGNETPLSGLSSVPESAHTDTAADSAPSTPLLQRSLRSHKGKVVQNRSHEDGVWSGGSQHIANSKLDESSPESQDSASQRSVKADMQTDRPETPASGITSKSTSATHTPSNVEHKNKKSAREEKENKKVGNTIKVEDILDYVASVKDAKWVIRKFPPAEIEAAVALIDLSRQKRALESQASNDSSSSLPPATSSTTAVGAGVRSQEEEHSRSPTKKRVAATAFDETTEVEEGNKKPDRRQAK